MKYHLRTSLSVLISLIVIGGVFSVGVYVGVSRRPAIEKVTTVAHKEPQVETKADFNTFWKVWNILNEKSLYSNKVSDQDRVWGAASGLASSLGDPYTVFFPPSENKIFNDEIRGSFGGIGAEIGMKDKILTIVSPIRDTPAWKAGIKAGDKILKIDKTSTNDMTTDKAISLIRGPKGTTVTLVVLRPGERITREFKITRGEIEIPTIDTQLRPDGIFVIKFYSFSENSAQSFRNALADFADSGAHKMIIDLRGNPGGYLDSAVDIASWFIDQGKVIVTEDFGGNKKSIAYRSHGPRLFTDALQLIVLVDSGSASASEILAGALKEYGVAMLVGEKTFGKGSVQELVPVTDTTSLKVTVANWLTPKGVSITSSQGIEPDVKVVMTADNIEKEVDPQMDKAIELLKARS